MAKIEIYTQPLCPYCKRAMELFKQKNAVFEEINAPKGTPEREEAIKRSNGKTTVPQIFIDGRHIGGCDDLLALDKKGQLDPLLG